MARQRGGIAGFYDRNKGILQTLAPVAAGAIGGPLAGAAVGAAMRGFDRPGKSGIGFDIGQGAIGGITGYGAGKMGQSLRGGLSSLFAPKTALPPVDMASKIGMTGPASLPPVDMASKIGITGPAATPSLPPMDVASKIGMTGAAAGPSTSTDYIGSAVNRYLSQGGGGMPSASPTASLFSPAAPTSISASMPAPMPTSMPTPSPTTTPSFFRSREGIAALGQGAQAAAGLIGSQRQMAMEQERMDREQREAEARAQLMAMFAPRILSGFSTGYGSMAGGG